MRSPSLPVGFVVHSEDVIERPLGHGGFGFTYRALHRSLDVSVALKEFFPIDLVTPRADQTVVLRIRRRYSNLPRPRFLVRPKPSRASSMMELWVSSACSSIKAPCTACSNTLTARVWRADLAIERLPRTKLSLTAYRTKSSMR